MTFSWCSMVTRPRGCRILGHHVTPQGGGGEVSSSSRIPKSKRFGNAAGVVVVTWILGCVGVAVAVRDEEEHDILSPMRIKEEGDDNAMVWVGVAG